MHSLELFACALLRTGFPSYTQCFLDAKRDPRYLARVRQLPCCMCGAWPPNEAHHKVGGGMALKTGDRFTMPLCTRDHSDRHRLSGRFKGWTKERLREWETQMVMETMERLT